MPRTFEPLVMGSANGGVSTIEPNLLLFGGQILTGKTVSGVVVNRGNLRRRLACGYNPFLQLCSQIVGNLLILRPPHQVHHLSGIARNRIERKILIVRAVPAFAECGWCLIAALQSSDIFANAKCSEGGPWTFCQSGFKMLSWLGYCHELIT